MTLTPTPLARDVRELVAAVDALQLRLDGMNVAPSYAPSAAAPLPLPERNLQ